MKINLNKKQLKTLIISSACVIFGVLFCILSGKMIDFLKTAFCVVALIYGVFYLISYTVLSFDEKNSSTLYQSVVAIALGMLVIFIPSFFVMAIAGIVIVCDLLRLNVERKAKKTNQKIDKTKLTLYVIELVIAVALIPLCNTPVPQLLVSLFLGGLLIYEGVVALVYLFLEIRKEREKTTPEIDEHQRQVEEIEKNNKEQIQQTEDNQK